MNIGIQSRKKHEMISRDTQHVRRSVDLFFLWGHEKSNPGQASKGQFEISLLAEPTRSSLNSIGLIQAAIDQHPKKKSVIITT
ncbi:MAG: hypothetical protein CME31_12565 [Gimesia sp.]|uniref:Uncharacterized protein n=1 Tax=Gimesia maris TaxID=122 RepID=A0A3D3R7Y6_9PLAN|nr:hypothetical protein [Gimesia sp.]HCO24984.1 hypothetical protein [Gimesia maris]|tara:strand:- start:170794 stop:171042 length:249 start_codon:yes stop_codon:yes gene_type:complete